MGKAAGSRPRKASPKAQIQPFYIKKDCSET